MADKLTGRRRFRSVRKWGREHLVLQVEEEYSDADYAGGFIHTFKGIRWRDATTKDLTVEEVTA
jgi:hypothetical protein